MFGNSNPQSLYIWLAYLSASQSDAAKSDQQCNLTKKCYSLSPLISLSLGRNNSAKDCIANLLHHDVVLHFLLKVCFSAVAQGS